MKANIICTAIWAGVILSFNSYSNVMLTAPYARRRGREDEMKKTLEEIGNAEA